MKAVSVVAPGDREPVDLGPARITILEDGSTTSHRLGIAEIRLAPRSDGPPQHRHAEHDEGFYVVSGTAVFTVGATDHEAPPGTLVMVPPGAPHTFANPGDEPLVMINTFTPDLYVHYFGDMRDALALGASMPQAAAEVMPRYATTPADDFADDSTAADDDTEITEAPPTQGAPAMTAPTSTGPASRTVTIATGMGIPISEFGTNTEGSAVLYLHGGAGPRTMLGLAGALAEHVYGIVPTHPGFDGTARPDRFDTIADLADAYLDLLDQLDLTGVMVIGSSIGGWIASEMALRDNHHRVGALVLLNAVGIKAFGAEQVTDVRQLAPPQISELSFVNPALRPDFASFTEEQKAAGAANQKTLALYGGEGFTHDPKLRRRLHRITIPALVVWGEQDGIAPLGYGSDFAAALGNGHFAPIADAGHFPHIEQIGATLGAIGDFVDTVVKPDEA